MIQNFTNKSINNITLLNSQHKKIIRKQNTQIFSLKYLRNLLYISFQQISAFLKCIHLIYLHQKDNIILNEVIYFSFYYLIFLVDTFCRGYYGIIQRRVFNFKMDQSVNEPKKSKFSRMLSNYSKSQLHNITPMLLIISKDCKFSPKYPVYKLLKVISKSFLVNEMQCIFLTYLIQQTDWNIKENILFRNCENVKDIISCSIQTQQYKSLVLYIMACIFTVKYYLNEANQELYEQANLICKNFKIIFEGWVKKHSTIIAKINLKTLNRVYKAMYICTRDNNLNFNMMVDAILQISPAYSSDREKPLTKQGSITKPSDLNPKLEGGKLKPGVLTHKQYVQQSKGINNFIQQPGMFDISLIKKESDRLGGTFFANNVMKYEDDFNQEQLLFNSNGDKHELNQNKSLSNRKQIAIWPVQNRISQRKIQQIDN